MDKKYTVIEKIEFEEPLQIPPEEILSILSIDEEKKEARIAIGNRELTVKIKGRTLFFPSGFSTKHRCGDVEYDSPNDCPVCNQ